MTTEELQNGSEKGPKAEKGPKRDPSQSKFGRESASWTLFAASDFVAFRFYPRVCARICVTRIHVLAGGMQRMRMAHGTQPPTLF